MHHFDDGSGDTAASLRFYYDHRHLLGDIVEAAAWFPGTGGPHPYGFILRDDRGQELWLSGLAVGYAGEAPRAAMEVLIDAGFPAEHARTTFTTTTMRLRRHDKPAAAGAGMACALNIDQDVTPLLPGGDRTIGRGR